MPNLSADQWARVSPILDEALELPVNSRGEFLDRACSGDPEMRAAIEALLAADSAASDFLERPAFEYAGTPSGSAASSDGVGPPRRDRVGPYRVLQELARGGMGAVYLGERADGQFEQRVALKLVRGGIGSPEVVRRFLAERQILARLSHPNIARLLDGGVTPDGEPWFAMEYVAGQSITQYCRERGLDVAGRLTLFCAVGEAVRYAHGQLVVHRDLKPSNILVAEDGTVKLLDFGIAKLLSAAQEEGAGVSAEPATRTEMRVMTPEYAAPEQVRGEPVTTATDVYALGVVLYELLTGRRVHRFARHTPAEYERVVCETEPTPPSNAVEHERLRRALRGDLDTIVLKALEKEPARRYASVEALLEDLRRYQDGRPIRGRQASRWYRARKFVRRHSVGVAVSTLLLGVIAAGVAGVMWQARAAEREAARAKAARDFLADLFRGAGPAEARGENLTARQLLERGVRRIDSALAGQPELQQDLLGELGSIHQSLGLYDQADTLLGRAVALARAAYGDDHPELGRQLDRWAMVQKLKGNYPRAESLLTEALAIRRKALGPRHPDVGVTLGNLAIVVGDMGQYARAESLMRETLAIDIAHEGPEGLAVASDLGNLGVLLAETGNMAGADSAYRASLAIKRRHLHPEHPELLDGLSNFAQALKAQARYAEAEEVEREVLAIRRKIHGPEDPEVAYALHTLGGTLGSLGRFDEAEAHLVQALAIRRKRLGETHPETMASLNNLAILRYRAGRLEEAAQSFREAFDGFRRAHGPDHDFTLSAQSNLGFVLTDLGRYDEAEPILRDALRRTETQFGDSSITTATRLRVLGQLLHRTGRLAESERVLRRALAITRRERPDHPWLATSLTFLGELLTTRGRPAEADTLLREALAIRTAREGADHFQTAVTARALGENLAAEGRWAEAESVLVASHAVLARRAPEGLETARAREALAAVRARRSP